MSTKRQLREQEEERNAKSKAGQRLGFMRWSYLAVCLLLLVAVFLSQLFLCLLKRGLLVFLDLLYPSRILLSKSFAERSCLIFAKASAVGYIFVPFVKRLGLHLLWETFFELILVRFFRDT